MGLTEWVLLALVVLVPLAIAVVVTLWSLEQARYRPKRRGRERTTPSAGNAGSAAENDDSPPSGAGSDDAADSARPPLTRE